MWLRNDSGIINLHLHGDLYIETNVASGVEVQASDTTSQYNVIAACHDSEEANLFMDKVLELIENHKITADARQILADLRREAR